ncbi:unnamed protein product [Prunus brigantina]
MKKTRRCTTEASSSRPNRQHPTTSTRRQRGAPQDHFEDTTEVEDVAFTHDSNVDAEVEDLLVNYFGVTGEKATKQLHQYIDKYVSLSWLQAGLSNVSNTYSEEYIMYSPIAYLLYLLGCTLFVDKTGTRVQIVYLRLLRDFDSVAGYSWSSGCLAWLYRQLSQASRSKMK